MNKKDGISLDLSTKMGDPDYSTVDLLHKKLSRVKPNIWGEKSTSITRGSGATLMRQIGILFPSQELVVADDKGFFYISYPDGDLDQITRNETKKWKNNILTKKSSLEIHSAPTRKLSRIDTFYGSGDHEIRESDGLRIYVSEKQGEKYRRYEQPFRKIMNLSGIIKFLGLDQQKVLEDNPHGLTRDAKTLRFANGAFLINFFGIETFALLPEEGFFYFYRTGSIETRPFLDSLQVIHNYPNGDLRFIYDDIDITQYASADALIRCDARAEYAHLSKPVPLPRYTENGIILPSQPLILVDVEDRNKKIEQYLVPPKVWQEHSRGYFPEQRFIRHEAFNHEARKVLYKN